MRTRHIILSPLARFAENDIRQAVGDCIQPSCHQTDYPRAARTFEMRMLMRICIDVCMKTPHPVVTYHPMDITICIQPFKYPIERDTIQSVLTLETLFNLMMADRMSLPQKHGKDLHPA